MIGGPAKKVTFKIVECPGPGAIMRVTGSKCVVREYPLSEDDLYRLQNEVQENIVMCIKKGAQQTDTLINDIRREGI